MIKGAAFFATTMAFIYIPDSTGGGFSQPDSARHPANATARIIHQISTSNCLLMQTNRKATLRAMQGDDHWHVQFIGSILALDDGYFFVLFLEKNTSDCARPSRSDTPHPSFPLTVTRGNEHTHARRLSCLRVGACSLARLPLPLSHERMRHAGTSPSPTHPVPNVEMKRHDAPPPRLPSPTQHRTCGRDGTTPASFRLTCSPARPRPRPLLLWVLPRSLTQHQTHG